MISEGETGMRTHFKGLTGLGVFTHPCLWVNEVDGLAMVLPVPVVLVQAVLER